MQLASPEVFLAFRETQSSRRDFVGFLKKCVLLDLWHRTGYSGHKWYVEHTLVKSLIRLMLNVAHFSSLLSVTSLGIGIKYRAIVWAPLPANQADIVIFNVFAINLGHIKR